MSSNRQVISNRCSDQLTRNGNSASSNNFNGDSFSARRRRHQSAPPRSNSFRESSSRPSATTVSQGAALVVPATSASTVSTVRVPPPPPPRRQVNNFEYVEHRAWERRGVSQDDSYYAVRGFSYNRGQQVHFNCLTTTPLHVQLNQGRINMNMPGFGGNNVGYGQHQMRHSHDASRSNGSAQTVNHGSSIFNFYFVNSGQYDLNFTGNGLPGVGQSNGPYQPAGQPGNVAQQQMSNYPAPFTMTDQFFGNAPHGNDYDMYGQPRNATHASYVSGPHHPSVSTPYPQRSPAHLQPLANGNSNAQFGPMPQQHDASAFHHYRQREPCYNTSYTNSQGSLNDWDESLRDDQDYTCHSQCSQKSAAASYGGPGRFDGPPPPMY